MPAPAAFYAQLAGPVGVSDNMHTDTNPYTLSSHTIIYVCSDVRIHMYTHVHVYKCIHICT